MNPTQLKTRALWISSQLRTEALAWTGWQQRELINGSVALALQARDRDGDPSSAAVTLDLATELLVKAQAQRFVKALDKGLIAW